MTTLEKLQTIDFDDDSFWAIARSFDASGHGLDESDIPQLLDIGGNSEWHNSYEKEEWGTASFALLALQQLKSVKGLRLTYELLIEEDEREKNFEYELLIDYSKSNPEDFFELAEEVYDSSDCQVKDTFAEGIGIIANADSSKEERAEQFFVERLRNHQKWHDHNNGYLIMGLIEANKGKENYDLVKEAFDTDNVDEFVLGDLEDFEIEIGMRAERETPSPGHYSKNMFDKVFDNMMREIDPEARERLIDSVEKEVRQEKQAELRKALSDKGKKKLNLKKMKKKKK